MNNIFIDMDGVLCDLVPAVLGFHGIIASDYDWPRGEYDLTKVFGPGILDCLPEIYETIQPSAECFELLKLCGPDAYICTYGLEGPKRQWLAKYGIRNKVIFIKDKWLLAKPGRLLIDDCGANCDQWFAEGGTDYEWKQHWNWGVSRMEGVRDEISTL